MLRDNTILVTGWTGFIGRHLVSALGKVPGIKLFLFSRTCPTPVPNGATWISGSLQDLTPETWREATHFDVVFHLAGFVSRSAADANNVEEAYSGNLVGTRRLLESLPENTSRFVLASTMDVYGPEERMITEESLTNPCTVYAATKLFCESLVRIHGQEAGISSSILRLGHIFGPGEESYRKLIPEVIRQLLAGESPRVFGSGAELRDFLFVKDAVEAILRSATTQMSHVGPINIVRGQSVSVRRVVEIIAETLHHDGDVEQVDSTLQGRSMRFDATRMKNTFNMTEFTSLESGLQEEIEDFRRKSARGSGTETR